MSLTDYQQLEAEDEAHKATGQASTSHKRWFKRPVTMPLWALLLGALFAMGFGGAVTSDENSQTKSAAPAPAPTVRVTEYVTAPAPQAAPAQPVPPAPAPAAAPAPKGPATSFSDGVHKVGEDIAVGQYKTSGPSDSSVMNMCYWSRSSDASGDSIITNDIVQGPARLTVKAGEYLKASGGCTWEKTA